MINFTAMCVADKHWNLVEAVKEGDIIQYDKHAGSGISVKNTYYYVISIRDVVVVEWE